MSATLDLMPSPASVGAARRFTVETLTNWRRDDVVLTAALLVTELVTNSVLHARTPLRLRLERHDDGVRVEVTDASTARPAVRHHSLDATTGRGLAMVAKLGRAWGVDVSMDGKTVWVDIERNADEQWTDDIVVLSDPHPDPRTRSDDEPGEQPTGSSGPMARRRTVAPRPARWCA